MDAFTISREKRLTRWIEVGRLVGMAILFCLVLLGCSKEKGAPPSSQGRSSRAVTKDNTTSSVGRTIDQPRKPDQPKKTDETTARARHDFSQIGLADSVRLKAAGVLLEQQVNYLVKEYGQRDNARLVRRLIETRIAADDEGIIPLILGLFKAVKGEERIDFEIYLLGFGTKVEGELVGLLGHADTHLVMRSLDALGKMKAVAAVDSIAPLLSHADAWVRMGAAHALGDIGAAHAVPLLVVSLQDSAHSVVNAALVGLGRLRALEAYDAIRVLVDSDNRHIRKHAAIALGELGDARAIEAVRLLASNDKDSGVRFMAGKALEKLEAGQ